MNQLVFMAMLAVTLLTSFSETASAQGRTDPKTAEATLRKYSTEDLRRFLIVRRNKSAYEATPADIKNISSGFIADTIIYRQKSIYGTDRRKDFNEIRDLKILSAANSVAVMVKRDHYTESASTLQLVGKSLGEEVNLCSGQHYFSQPSVGYCTAFVIGVDSIATAGHCVPAADDMASTRVVFGFRAQNGKTGLEIGSAIAKEDVYVPVKVITRKEEELGLDYAIIQVDRPIANHAVLPLSSDGKLKEGDEVYVLGHPLGLPMKLADGAHVRRISDKGYFVSNLDTFGGNSGSPVFLAGTLTVQGILVRGDVDFIATETCNVAFVCPAGPAGCRGEDATLISYLVPSVPKAMPAPAAQPFNKTFTSGPVLSGSRKSFSPEYVVRSEPAPQGYVISGFVGALGGDRACNAWSTCAASMEGDRVVFKFTLQGHDEWPGNGQALSTGNLLVTYSPKQ